MKYSREFFDLQLEFADRVTALSGLPLGTVLLEYTNLYVRLGFGREFDPNHDGWRRFLEGLPSTPDPNTWAYEYYSNEAEQSTAPELVTSFGCFSYGRNGDAAARIHFHNIETQDVSPLCEGRAPIRRDELRRLAAHVEETLGAKAEIVGASWLYNVEPYRRLFPDSYLASGFSLPRRYRSMTLWGQFLDRHRRVRSDRVRPFLDEVANACNLIDLDDCFPLEVLAMRAPVEDFVTHYQVETLD